MLVVNKREGIDEQMWVSEQNRVLLGRRWLCRSGRALLKLCDVYMSLLMVDSVQMFREFVTVIASL